jgi:SAM-dependent methyltransferase
VYARVMWFLLPAVASVLLLAVTNKICQDVAVIPFLWVLPLSLYLLTFILCFDHPRWYLRSVFVPLLVVALYLLAKLAYAESSENETITFYSLRWLINRPGWTWLEWSHPLSILVQIYIYTGTMFVCCMTCHGELSRMRPHPKYLTGYFLAIAAGGAAGGIFVAIFAPKLFQGGFFELQLGVFLCAFLVAVRLFTDKRSALYGPRYDVAGAVLVNAFGVVFLAAILFLGYWLDKGVKGVNSTARDTKVVNAVRNFYGTLKVFDENYKEPSREVLVLYHGAITHGLQYTDPIKRERPTSYYGPSSGAGLCWQYFPRVENRRMAVVGLGSGSMAAWAKKGDWLSFYEINPDILRLAHDPFTYVDDANKRGAKVDVVLGDGRLSLENQPSQGYDVMFLDAFSGDAIPVHLLTKECFDQYKRHLKPDGVIAVHISNRHLDLQPVVLKLAQHFGYDYAIISDDPATRFDEDEEGNYDEWLYESDWVLLSANKQFLQTAQVQAESSAPRPRKGIGLWTDDSTNLFQIMRVRD